MTQILTPPSITAIRDELQSLVIGDLLGPAGGPDEELAEVSVSDRYLVGMLAPQRRAIGNEAFEDLALGGAETHEDGKTDVGAPQAKTLIPSSVGMTFTMAKETSAMRITARWGRYLKEDSATIENPKTGNPQKIWKRTPMGNISGPIKLNPGPIKPWIVTEKQPEIIVRGLVRKKAGDWIITLFLVNGQQDKKRLADEAWIFQPELIVEAVDGSAAFVKRPQQHDSSKLDQLTYAEEQTMAMLYRNHVEFAVGHGVAIHADTAQDNLSRAFRISIQAAPVFEVSKQTPPHRKRSPFSMP